MLATRRIALTALVLTPVLAVAQAEVDTSSANLMVVLRESINADFKQESTLQYIGRIRFQDKEGKDVELEMAHYAYLADTHIRFVFDGPTMMRNATPADLTRLGLTPATALDLAITNIRRVYGEAKPVRVAGELMQVESKSPDLISSYLLDTDFWSSLERQHPEGIVAAVPKRGGLLFTPASNSRAVQGLREGVRHLFRSSDRLRVSSALYLFKGGRWSTFQDPVAKE